MKHKLKLIDPKSNKAKQNHERNGKNTPIY